jgi:hypothetical protein
VVSEAGTLYIETCNLIVRLFNKPQRSHGKVAGVTPVVATGVRRGKELKRDSYEVFEIGIATAG